MPGDTLLDDLRWLVGEAAKPWLAIAAEAGDATPRLVKRLRGDLSAQRARLAIEQARLRQRAKDKFVHAERMFFTQLGLEQATDQWLASYKANRFPQAAAIADLCCGVGGDSIALASRGPSVGVDRDPAIAILAEANLRVNLDEDDSAGRFKVRCEDVNEFDFAECAGWHIDPDRRPKGRRTTQPALHEPSVDAIERLLVRCHHAAIKLAPAAELPDDWHQRAELEWISRRRECRQLVAWFGDLATQRGQRRATVLGPTGECLRTIVGQSGAPLEVALSIDAYVFEPDAAVLAAGLTGTLATERHLAAITPGVAYLTSSDPLADAALACFRVLDILPLRIKTLKVWLNQREIGDLEIKKRGVDLDPAQLRKQLSAKGPNCGVLLIAKVNGRPTVIAAERVIGLGKG